MYLSSESLVSAFTLSNPLLAYSTAYNSITTIILPGLSLASTKTRNKRYRPTTTITICKYYSAKPTITAMHCLWASRLHQTFEVK